MKPARRRMPWSPAAAMFACCLALALVTSAAEPPASDIAATAENQESQQTTMVIVEGVGPDVESARKDAYRAAVRQVLGTLVDSETLVENDQLVTDKVVVFSDGYVSGVKDIPNGVTKENGFVRVRVKAFVKAGKLADSLRANAIAPAGSAVQIADPRSDFAQALTEQERKKNAREAFFAAAARYPADCFAAEVGQPKIKEIANGTAKCELRIKIAAKQKEYDEFVSKLMTYLEREKIDARGECELTHTDQGIRAYRQVLKGPVQDFIRDQYENRRNLAVVDIGNRYCHDFKKWDYCLNKADRFLHAFEAHYRRGAHMVVEHACKDEACHVRWFIVDPELSPWPDMSEEMVCRVVIRDLSAVRFERLVTIKQFGYLNVTLASKPTIWLGAGWFETGTFCFGPTFEFTVPLDVPEIVFDSPGLAIEATLANATPEPTKP